MKKILLIALLLAAFTPTFAFEYTYEGNTLEYTPLTENTVSVQKSTVPLTGTVVIPSVAVDVEIDKAYNVTHIADNGFYKADQKEHMMESIVIPEGIVEIGYKAFAQCYTKFQGDIVLPSTVSTIKSRAFFNCQHINLVITSSIPPALEADGDYKWFLSVEKIVVPVNQGVAYRKDKKGKSLSVHESIMSLWIDNVALNNVIVEPNEFLVNNGEINLYYRIDNDKAIVSGVKTNGVDLFAANIPATININDVNYSVKELADSAFYMDDNLTSLQLPRTLERIGVKALSKTGLFGRIVIPESVTDIGDYAFYASNKISEFYLKPLTAPKLTNNNAFTGSSAPLYVHCEATGYQNGKWSQLSERIKDVCLTIYHNGTHDELGNGVHETTADLVASITYKRTFSPGKWETLYLPFEIEKVTVEDEDEIDGYWSPEPWNIFDGGDYFLAEETGKEDGELCFDFTTASPVAHKPYLIQFPILEGEWSDYYVGRVVTFHGKEKWNNLSTSFAPLEPTSVMQMGYNNTLQNQTLSDKVYMLRGTDDFMLQHSATTLHPFECYVMPQKVSGAALAPRMSVRVRGRGNVTTSVSSTNATNPISYSIDGNRLTIYANRQLVQIYSINGILLHSINVEENMAQVLLDKGCYIIYSNGNSQKVIL